jgi:hypothetical protein
MRLTILLIGCLLSGFLFTPGKGGMSSSPQRPWPGSIETREGVVHVLNPQEGLWGGPTGEPEVERVWSVGGAGGRDEEVFSFIQDITTDSYGNVYACDSREDRVAVFDRDGRLVRSIGRTGAGPGDLARPRVIEVDDRGRLHVLEWTNLRVSLFSPDGVFTGSFRIDGIPSDAMGFHGDEVLLMLRSDEHPEQLVVTVDREGRRTGGFGERPRLLDRAYDGRPWYAGAGLTMRPDGGQVLFLSWPYRIEFRRGPELERVVERQAEDFPPPEFVESDFRDLEGRVERMGTVKTRSTLAGVFPLPEGGFVAFIMDYGKDWRENDIEQAFVTWLDLFDAEGRFLRRFTWDWVGRGYLRQVDLEGFFYSASADRGYIPGVSKWRVRFDR